MLDCFHAAGTVRATLTQAFHEIYDGNSRGCAEQEVALVLCKHFDPVETRHPSHETTTGNELSNLDGGKLSEVAHVETKGRIDAFCGRNDGLRDHLSTEHTARSDGHK